jgi:hypothetical protein
MQSAVQENKENLNPKRGHGCTNGEEILVLLFLEL